MRVLSLIFLVLAFCKCARQTQPNGGPKDTDPPELLSSIPSNEEKNFRGKTIELTFDEYVKLKDPKEEIIITPSPGTNTKFVVKKNKVIITPEKTLLDTTTYSIAFREGIQDINESNPTDDLHLAFSTGPTIDSLKISGSVSEVFKDKVPEKITIGLYQSDTFDIFQHKPPLFSKSDKNGKFAISNLKAGKYFIYAFDDKNKNQKVDSKSERFGFLAKGINLPQDKDTVQIRLVHLDTRRIKLTSIRNTSTVSIIRFNKPVDSINLMTQNKSIIYTFGDNQSEVIVYKNFEAKDSLKIGIFAKDSIDQKMDTAVYAKFTDSKIVQEKFKLSTWKVNYEPTSNLLKGEAAYNKLLSSINFDSIYIQIDTINFQPITPKEITIDTLYKKIKLKTTLDINPKQKIPNPVLLFGKGALVSIDSDSSKAQDIKLQIPKAESTGTLSVEIRTKEPHFEVLLTTANNAAVKSFRDLKKYTFTYLEPAEYKITIIVDSNNNQRWDPGDFYKREEPEKVILYRTIENKSSFPIRANWELGPLVITF
jgi:uncharacterized protein (DUF2141 family)